MTPQEVHNEQVGKIIDAIVRPIIDAGGTASDVCVTLESVMLGIMMFAETQGYNGVAMLDVASTGARRRFEEKWPELLELMKK